MPIRIVQLGSPRAQDEGLRIGTVRRPPRGVPKQEFATRNWYDVWFPNLSPTPETIKLGTAAAAGGQSGQWQAFVRAFRHEMEQPDAKHTLDLLAALSHQSNFSIGCYCEQESRCHRSVLRTLLEQRGADITP